MIVIHTLVLWQHQVIRAGDKAEKLSSSFPSAYFPRAVLGFSFLALQPQGAVTNRHLLRLKPGILDQQQCSSYRVHLPDCPEGVSKYGSLWVEHR